MFLGIIQLERQFFFLVYNFILFNPILFLEYIAFSDFIVIKYVIFVTLSQIINLCGLFLIAYSTFSLLNTSANM